MLHEAGNCSAAQGCEHEVDVVGHEAKGVDANLVATGEEVEPVEVEEEVVGLVEFVLALRPTLVDVKDLAALELAFPGRMRLSQFSSH
jgi:hypothetical protein